MSAWLSVPPPHDLFKLSFLQLTKPLAAEGLSSLGHTDRIQGQGVLIQISFPVRNKHNLPSLKYQVAQW